jgi:predicted nuclease of predicted toxin-antitoxin system
MRLLFDEQLSTRLPRLLADWYPDSLHIEALDLLRRHIEDLRQFAAQDEAAFLELGGRRLD